MASRPEGGPSQQPGGRGKSAPSRGQARGPQSQVNKGKGPDSHPVPNGTPPPPEAPASGGAMSWAARVASAKPTPPAANGSSVTQETVTAPAAPAPVTQPAAAPVAAPAAVVAPPAPQPAAAGVKLPPGVDGRQPSIKFGDIDPSEVVKEQQPPVPAPTPAAPAPKPAMPANPAPAAPAAPPPTPAPHPRQQPTAPAPLPVMPASQPPAPQRPGSFAAAAAGAKPAAASAVPVLVPPQGMPPQQMPQVPRQQHGPGPRGPNRGPPAQQQQPGMGLNPAMGVYPQQFGMPAFSMNPSANTFGPGMGGMMFMPGGSGYFAPANYQQAWQSAQYNQYGMNAAAMQAGAGGQQAMPPTSGMGSQQQQPPSSAPYAAAAADVPKPALRATPPREKKILRLEDPNTHEVIDLSKPMAAGSQPTSGAAAKPSDNKQPAPAAKAAEKPPAPPAADAKKPEAPAAAASTPAPEAAKAAAVPPKAAAEAAAAAALKAKPAAEPAAPVPEAAAPAAPQPEAAEAPPAPAATPAAAAGAATAPSGKSGPWGASQSFKDKLMVDPAEKKRQEEQAAEKKAAEEAAARKKAEEEEAERMAAEEQRRKAAEEEQQRKAAEEAERQRAAEAEARRKADEADAQRKAEDEAAAKKEAEEAAAAKKEAEEEAAAKKEAEEEAAVKKEAEQKAASAAAAAAATTAAAAAAKESAAAEAAAAPPAKQAPQPEAESAAAPAIPEAAQQAAAVAGGSPVKSVAVAGEEAGDAHISPFSSTAMEEGEIADDGLPRDEEVEPPTGYEDDSGRKRYSMEFFMYYRPRCMDVPKGIEAETFKQLSRDNMPPGGAPPGPRGARSGGFGADDRWQSGRMPSGPVPGGPPGMRGDPRMLGRQPSGRRTGVEADQWERGKPLPPMPGMPAFDGRRGGPPPGMRMPGGPTAQLHKTSSAYKVGATRTDDPAEEKAQKQLKSLLNKITKDNFAKITGQIIEVINERKLAKTLSGFINQIFDKALTETHFAELYADLVAALNPALPQLKDDEGNDVQFRRTLLNKCQEEFEAGVTAMKAVSEREKHAKETGEAPVEEEAQEDDKEEEEAKEEGEEKEEEVEEAPAADDGEVVDEAKAKANAEAAAKKAELAARKEERRKAMAELQARKRMLGNIVFVGQLFKKGVLTETVMHTCIKQLLEEVENPKPEDVECMCKLLATVGGLLDSSTKQVKNFNNGKPASTKEVMNVYFGRIEVLGRNEALDSRHRFMLMDLIDQRRNRWRPRKEAEGPKTIEEIHREEALKRSRSAMLDRQGSSRGDSFRGAPRGGPPPGRPPFDNRVDAPIRAMARVGSNDFLGPGGQQSFRPGGRPGPQRGPERPASGGAMERQPSARQQGPPAPPTRAERAPEPPAAREEPEAAAAPAADGEASEEAMQSKAKGLLAELYNSKELKEGLTSIKELVEQGADVAMLFETMLTFSLETRGTDWDMFAAVLCGALEDGLLQSGDLEQGARAVLDNLDDMTVDVPKAPLQVGTLLGELVAAGGADLKILAEHIRTADANPEEIQEGEDTMLVGGGNAAKTLGSLLQKLAAVKGADAAKEAWEATGEKLSAFLPQSDREDEAAIKQVAEQFDLLSIAC